jgi:hypothetical protein
LECYAGGSGVWGKECAGKGKKGQGSGDYMEREDLGEGELSKDKSREQEARQWDTCIRYRKSGGTLCKR